MDFDFKLKVVTLEQKTNAKVKKLLMLMLLENRVVFSL